MIIDFEGEKNGSDALDLSTLGRSLVALFIMKGVRMEWMRKRYT